MRSIRIASDSVDRMRGLVSIFHLAPVAMLLSALLSTPARSDVIVEEITDFTVVDPGTGQGTGHADALVWNSKNRVWVDRAISVPLPRTLPMGHLQYVIEHRNRTPVDQDPFDNFLGFDSGNLKIGFELRYGLLDNLDISIYRQNGTVEIFDTWQYAMRYQPLNEQDHFIDAAILGGLTVFTVQNGEDASGGFGGLLIGRSFSKYLYASVGGLSHSDSTSFAKTLKDEDESAAVPGSITAHLKPGFALVAETSIPVDGYDAGSVAWAGAAKFITHGHTFSIVAGNTQYTSLDGLAAGTSFPDDEVVLGFSITRAFEIYDFDK
ncbi:MAG: DUF5777 family beta-barrel protein [Verrucomicrobia bacterium]|nr:DUF5777 family beta-barrel protein [Verrucomicrobiota bacterium]